jgi:hypothetical protein
MSRLDGDVGVAKSAGPGSRGVVFGVVLEGWKDYTGTGLVGGSMGMLFVALPSNVRPCVCVCRCQRQAVESSGQREMQ